MKRHPAEEQIQVAADWWAGELAIITSQGNGDPMCSAYATVVAFELPRPSPEQVAAFRTSLVNQLREHIDRKSWKNDNPYWGSYMRTVGCDYGPDGSLRQAAEAAGIKPCCPPFPLKTVMWINPDKVSVSHGYRAEPRVLWTEAAEVGSDGD